VQARTDEEQTTAGKGNPQTKRMVVLAMLVMAAVLVLSAPMAEAKKKHHHVVHCDQSVCIGTAGNDHLIGTDRGQIIAGGEGNDVYEDKGGFDELLDSSTTSNDTYVFKGPIWAVTTLSKIAEATRTPWT
jgi:Ca2+-binding RTX toxin-like protein